MSKSTETSQIHFDKITDPSIETKAVRPNILVRGINKIKSHPKIALTAAAGAGLIVGAYALGRSQPTVAEIEADVDPINSEYDSEIAEQDEAQAIAEG